MKAMLAGAAIFLLGPVCEARVFVTQEEALGEAFPGLRVERRNAFLTDEQARQVVEMAGSPPSSRIVSYYVAESDGNPAGSAFFDTHLVRTFPETVMIVIEPGGTIDRIVVLSFDEPEEYLPRSGWFDLFPGRRLDRDLAPGRGLPVVTGATLTSRAVVGAARRALALHALLISRTDASKEREAGGGGEDGEDR
jgi:hypothetical protein